MINKMNIDFTTIVDRRGTYSTQWDYVKDRFGATNLLPFTISDMDFKSPKGVSDVITRAAEKGVFGYTRWNNPDFKNAIVNWYDRRYETRIKPESIVYSPSVIYSLAKLLDQFSDFGDKVLTFSPCYDAFINTVYSNHRKLIQMRVDEGLILGDLKEYFIREQPSILLLCNPHNPLGTAWTKSQLKQIIELCNSYHVAIISDEIHMDIVRGGVKATSLAHYFEDITTSCAIITSASKSFNIPALGCSYALIKNEKDRIDFLYSLKQKNALSSVPYLGMLATIECYNNQEEWLNELNIYIDDNFKYLQSFLANQLGVNYKIPDATYLGWIDISSLKISMDELQKELVDNQKVAIMDGKIYGNGGANHLRFNLGASKLKIEDGLDRLNRAIKKIHQN